MASRIGGGPVKKYPALVARIVTEAYTASITLANCTDANYNPYYAVRCTQWASRGDSRLRERDYEFRTHWQALEFFEEMRTAMNAALWPKELL